MSNKRLQLSWHNKDMALIPTETGKYGYTWVNPADPRYCETHVLVFDEYINGMRREKSQDAMYSALADLEPQFDNLLINGESGDVLETLTRVPELADKYLGKIKLVYIDPPFNTAQTFASYEDNLEHSIWLTMMRDRLLHLKRLLSDDGLIWVHLDDAEVHRMRLLMDEVFGAANFISEVAWEKTFKPKNDAKGGFSSRHDILLVYSKSPSVSWNRLPRTASMDAAYSNPDNDPLGSWTSAPATANHGDGAGGMCYAIQSPLTGELLRPPHGGSWRFGQDTMLESLSKWAPYRLEDLHDEEWRAQNEGVLLEKVKHGVKALLLDCDVDVAREMTQQRLAEGNWPRVYVTSKGGFRSKSYLATKPGRVPEDWWLYTEAGSNDEAKSEIKKLFPGTTPFSTPKPERLLKRIIHISTCPGDIVLDCFAGSGTTAAVAQKMGRRWITCELLKSTYDAFTRPRLERVVLGKDLGGITISKGERVAAEDANIPDSVSPDDAALFVSILNKVLQENEDLKSDPGVKKLKAITKTTRSKDVVNWLGGGGFQAAHLAPECFDYSPDVGQVLLTEHATGDLLVESIAANLSYTLIKDNEASVFDGRRGNSLLKVIEGVATVEIVDWLVSQISPGMTIVIAALGVLDGVRAHLRKACKGSRIVVVPDDIFPYSGEEAE